MSFRDELIEKGYDPDSFECVNTEFGNAVIAKIEEQDQKYESLSEYVSRLEETIAALTRAQMNRPMYDHNTDAMGGLR